MIIPARNQLTITAIGLAGTPKTKTRKAPGKPGVIARLVSDEPNLYADLSAGSGDYALTRDEGFTAWFLDRQRKQLLFYSDCPSWDGCGGNVNGVCYSTQFQALLHRIVRVDLLFVVLLGSFSEGF